MLLIGSSLLIDPFRAHLLSPLARMYRNVRDSSKIALALTTVLKDVKQKEFGEGWLLSKRLLICTGLRSKSLSWVSGE